MLMGIFTFLPPPPPLPPPHDLIYITGQFIIQTVILLWICKDQCIWQRGFISECKVSKFAREWGYIFEMIYRVVRSQRQFNTKTTGSGVKLTNVTPETRRSLSGLITCLFTLVRLRRFFGLFRVLMLRQNRVKPGVVVPSSWRRGGLEGEIVF